MTEARSVVPPATRATRRAANAGLLAAALFGVTAVLTTQVSVIRETLPSSDDPYDAVVSVASILVPFVVLVTWLRSVRNSGAAGIPEATRSRIHRGVGLVLALVLAGVVAYLTAIVGLGAPEASPVVILLIAATGLSAVVAAILLGRAIRTDPTAPGELTAVEPEPDSLDDLVAIIHGWARSLRPALPDAGRLVDRATDLVDTIVSSRLGPRRHRALWIGFVAVILGFAGTVWRGFIEGPWASPIAAALYGTILAAIVGFGLGVLGSFLRVLRRA